MDIKTTKIRPHSHPTTLTAANLNRNQAGRRRSDRMKLNATVGLTGEDRQKCSFTMPARATWLNKHGAAVQLNRELQMGAVVILKHPSGAQVSARVVAQLTASQGVSTYGVEFVEHDESTKNFWGITFPSNA
jgi:hypothetical protein